MHCIAQVNATTLFISGGYGRATFEDCRWSTYFLTHSTLTPGPDMISKRAEHGCSFINDRDGTPTAIVAGGFCQATNLMDSGQATNGVEIYNSALNEWERGPELPVALRVFQVRLTRHCSLELIIMTAQTAANNF